MTATDSACVRALSYERDPRDRRRLRATQPLQPQDHPRQHPRDRRRQPGRRTTRFANSGPGRSPPRRYATFTLARAVGRCSPTSTANTDSATSSDPRDHSTSGDELTAGGRHLAAHPRRRARRTSRHEPGWFNRPAITQRTISTPRLHRLLGGGRSSDSRHRPYSFCNHAILHPDEPRPPRAATGSTSSPPTSVTLCRWTAMEWVEAPDR